MSVSSKARRLAAACRRAMPDANVEVCHSRRPWGCSSYVHVTFARLSMKGSLYAKARVSDHGIGRRRYDGDTCSLYLAETSKPEAWSTWLGGLVRQYERLGGTVPRSADLFTSDQRTA